VATFANPNISGTSDGNSGGSLNPNSPFTGTYSIDSTGLGVVPAGCTIIGTPGTCQSLFYIISPTKAVVLSLNSTSTNPDLQVADK
jgi:hypothetical protein